jgi:hypothetical protein
MLSNTREISTAQYTSMCLMHHTMKTCEAMDSKLHAC